MSNVWTANTVRITKSERDVGNGNKAIDIGFTSAILQDGVFHHAYNEPNLGLNPNLTIEEHVSRIIQNHLAAWTVAGAATNGQVVPDVALPGEKVKDPIDVDREAMYSALNSYLQMTAQFNAAALNKAVIKITDADLDTAYGAWKQTMIHDEFWALIPKDFPTR